MREYEVIYQSDDGDDFTNAHIFNAPSARRAYDLFYEYDYSGVAIFVVNINDSKDYYDPFEEIK